jgi:hypothetical protein
VLLLQLETQQTAVTRGPVSFLSLAATSQHQQRCTTHSKSACNCHKQQQHPAPSEAWQTALPNQTAAAAAAAAGCSSPASCLCLTAAAEPSLASPHINLYVLILAVLASVVVLFAACCVDIAFDGAAGRPPARLLCIVCVAEPALSRSLADLSAAVGGASWEVIYLVAWRSKTSSDVAMFEDGSHYLLESRQKEGGQLCRVGYLLFLFGQHMAICGLMGLNGWCMMCDVFMQLLT